MFLFLKLLSYQMWHTPSEEKIDSFDKHWKLLIKIKYLDNRLNKSITDFVNVSYNKSYYY